MDCTLTQAELVAYHLGVIDDAARTAIDAHLVACTACLRAYLALKHHMDAGAPERPSAAARARLRAAVEAHVAPTRGASVRRFFGRPIPLYQGLAAMAAAVVLAVAVPAALGLRASSPSTPRAPSTYPHSTQHGAVDSARPVAESLSIY